MKILFIGGTGNISTAVSNLAVQKGIDLYLLNRGKSDVEIQGVKTIQADIYKLGEAENALKNHEWDVVVNWIAFTAEHVKNDLELFRNSTKQYIFISSASAYQKPPTSHIITESTPLSNPFWQYARDKIGCENLLLNEFQENEFPVTIVRPSHTYDTVIPVAFGGWKEYNIIDRMKKGLPVIIHGDGTSLWTLTHSEDFATGFAGLMGNEQAIGQVFQITSDEVFNWNQIYEVIAEAAGADLNPVYIPSDFISKIVPELKGPLLGDKTYSATFDNSKIKTFVPEFEAIIPFKEGIRRTLNWFEEKSQRRAINPDTSGMYDKIIHSYNNK